MKILAAALIALTFILSAPPARAMPQTPPGTEIQYLIGFVRASGLTFIRNGSSYTAAAAADHIAMKYGQVSDRIASAEEFIETIASKSSLTGRPYLVRLADGTEREAGEWLRGELKKHRSSAAAPAAATTPVSAKLPAPLPSARSGL